MKFVNILYSTQNEKKRKRNILFLEIICKDTFKIPAYSLPFYINYFLFDSKFCSGIELLYQTCIINTIGINKHTSVDAYYHTIYH